MNDNPVADVVGVVLATIEKHAPTNVDREAVTVTGEGADVRIVLVPHRDLAGTALVIWADEQGNDLRWAQIRDLSTHDDVDLGTHTATVDWEGDWQGKLRSAVLAELVRPIRLQSKGTPLGKPLTECWLDLGEKAKRIAVLHPKLSLSGESHSQPGQWETHFGRGRPASGLRAATVGQVAPQCLMPVTCARMGRAT